MENKNHGTSAQEPKSANKNPRGDDRETMKENHSAESNPDNFGDDPEKKKEIGDDPDGTQKKIPRMSN